MVYLKPRSTTKIYATPIETQKRTLKVSERNNGPNEQPEREY
jgi:hypothetical protein